MAIKYIRSFDGLRGIGALMILLYHWPFKTFDISHGWEFMQMFFVMSGYLITVVLLEEKEKFAFRKFAGRFYLKRSLRLFPLYFAYLLAALAVYLITSKTSLSNTVIAADVARHWPYLFTYTFNWMNIVNFFCGWDYSSENWATHLWTLSMEEQFYLVFPFFAFYLSLRNLRILAIICIVGAFFFRIVSYQWYIHLNPDDNVWIVQNLVRIPFAQMDSFAFGACLALFPLDFIKNSRKWFYIATTILLMTYGANMAYVYFIEGASYYQITFGKKVAEAWMAHNYLFTYLITLVNFWCALFILFLKRSTDGNKWLEVSPLVFLGRLSYGFYLLHLPILSVFYLLTRKFWTRAYINEHILLELTLLIIYFIVTTYITHIVHTHFEIKFLHLKNKLVKKPA